MSWLDFVIRKPVTVVVGVILVALFGVIAAIRLPVQLTPDVDRAIITVATNWEGASPQEVEREILDEQEDRLKGIPGLEKMTGTAVEGRASIELEFRVGADTARALVEVNDRLRQVPSYPENVDQPVVSAGDTQGASAIAWFILERTEGSPVARDDVPDLRTFIVNRIKPMLERADGISAIGVFGGRETEIHIKVDPYRLAARGLSMADVRRRIRERNVDVSAGTIDVGKSAYSVRTVGKFESLEEINQFVLARSADGSTVQVADVGSVTLGFKESTAIVRSLGQPALALNASRQSGTNVLAVMESLKGWVERANVEVLADRGLTLRQVYDQTVYIDSSIDLVVQNLWVGGGLAIAVLLLFLRSARSTLVVAVAIPVSVVGSFLALDALDRNLNVISLAGLAFAVGMVVDNSIVVLESIDRHRRMGKRRRDAARDGTADVAGAVLASTLTTLAVFIPVTLIEEEAGQLFRDIAIAISASVALSLIVSVLFIPMAAARLLPEIRDDAEPGWIDRYLGRPGARVLAAIVATVAWLDARLWRRLVTFVGITSLAIFVSWLLLPPMTYLPAGNRNLVFGFLIPPPGYSNDEFVRTGELIEERMAPYWKDRGRAITAELAHPDWYDGEDPIPGIDNFFFVAFGQSVFMGARSVDDSNVKPLEKLFGHATSRVPGMFAFAAQASLFDRGVTAGNSIDLEVSGADLDEVQAAAGMLLGTIYGTIGPARPTPSNFNLGAPELQVAVDEARATQLGLSVSDVGLLVQSMIDGAIVSDYDLGGDRIDVKVVPPIPAEDNTEAVAQLPIYTPSGRIVPLGSIATITETTAPNEILHLEERRAVKLSIAPPDGQELSTVMDRLEGLIAGMRASGALSERITTTLAGTADKLVSTRDAMKWNLVLAIVITYLLLSALFESFIYPVVILVTVPLAAVGGIAGLRLVHEVNGQQMDVLTLLGFVILIGTVVNNAILIVHHALARMRDDDADPRDAVLDGVRTRVRPIFMSTLTSVLGMFPLVVFPGAGSELYRGLGSVVVGGLIASTVFTLFVVPTLFSLFLSAGAAIRAFLERRKGTVRV